MTKVCINVEDPDVIVKVVKLANQILDVLNEHDLSPQESELAPLALIYAAVWGSIQLGMDPESIVDIVSLYAKQMEADAVAAELVRAPAGGKHAGN